MKELIEKYGARLKEKEPMARWTTFKIGGPADWFFEAKTKEEFCDIVIFARRRKIPLFILGGGSNILVGDAGIAGLVVKNSTGGMAIRGMKGAVHQGTSENIVFVEVESGVIINKLVRFTIEEGLAGLEMHLGLPGTVGGAMYMNSKWTNPEGYVGDVVYQAIIILEGEQKSVPHSYFQFGYDWSNIQRTGDVVVSVVFALKRQPKEVLWDIANKKIMPFINVGSFQSFASGATHTPIL